MLFLMLPTRLKNLSPIIKKIKNKFFENRKFDIKQNESVNHKKLFSSRIRNKKK